MHLFSGNNKCPDQKENQKPVRIHSYRLNKIIFFIVIIAIAAGSFFYADYRRTVSGSKLSPRNWLN